MRAEEIVALTDSITRTLIESPFISAQDQLDLRVYAVLLNNLGNSDASIELLTLLRNHAQVVDDRTLLAEVTDLLGSIYNRRLMPKVAEFYLGQAFELYLEADERNRLGEVAVFRASNLIRMGEYEEASQLLDRVYPIYENLGDYSILAAIDGTRSMLFNRMLNEDRSLFYGRRAIHNAQLDGDDQRLMRIYSNTGILFRQTNPDSSLYYYDLAERMADELGDEATSLRSRFNRANIVKDQGEIEVAEKLYSKLQEESLRLQDQQGILLTRFAIATIEAMKGEFELSALLLEEVLAEMEQRDALSLMESSLREMITIYGTMGRQDLETEFKERLETLENKINSEETRLRVLQTSLIRNIEESDSELAVLKDEMLRRQFWLRVWSAAGVILILLLIYTSFVYVRRLKGEQVDQIERIKLSEKQKSILQIGVEIREKMTLEKLYRRKDLKVEDLCEITQVSRRRLIQAIHAEGWSGFADFVNSYRVEEMKRVLRDPENQKYSLDYLYTEVGFGSKQSFYKNFKKNTGMSPIEWRENREPESEERSG